MSLSDCEKCWETPCHCGYKYEKWSTEDVRKLRDVLDSLLARREAGKLVRTDPARTYSLEELQSSKTFVFSEREVPRRLLSPSEFILKPLWERRQMSTVRYFVRVPSGLFSPTEVGDWTHARTSNLPRIEAGLDGMMRATVELENPRDPIPDPQPNK